MRRINQEAEDRARKKRLQALRLDSEAQLESWPPFPIPHLGGACEGIDAEHERIETLFVDSSGFGAEGEGALTGRQFKDCLLKMLGDNGPLMLGIEDQGQFQLYVAVWKVNRGS
jgi:hypothetical protein